MGRGCGRPENPTDSSAWVSGLGLYFEVDKHRLKLPRWARPAKLALNLSAFHPGSRAPQTPLPTASLPDPSSLPTPQPPTPDAPRTQEVTW